MSDYIQKPSPVEQQPTDAQIAKKPAPTVELIINNAPLAEAIEDHTTIQIVIRNSPEHIKDIQSSFIDYIMHHVKEKFINGNYTTSKINFDGKIPDIEFQIGFSYLYRRGKNDHEIFIDLYRDTGISKAIRRFLPQEILGEGVTKAGIDDFRKRSLPDGCHYDGKYFNFSRDMTVVEQARAYRCFAEACVELIKLYFEWIEKHKPSAD